MRRSVRPAILVGAGVAGAVLLLRLRDPHVPRSYGVCPLLAVTGFDCPMCGGLRATNRLAHGDVLGALDSNALFTASVPLLVAGWLWWLARSAGWLPAPDWSGRWSNTGVTVLIAGIGALVLAFGIVRNLPGFEVLRAGL